MTIVHSAKKTGLVRGIAQARRALQLSEDRGITLEEAVAEIAAEKNYTPSQRAELLKLAEKRKELGL
jgi:hypothetical protein